MTEKCKEALPKRSNLSTALDGSSGSVRFIVYVNS